MGSRKLGKALRGAAPVVTQMASAVIQDEMMKLREERLQKLADSRTAEIRAYNEGRDKTNLANREAAAIRAEDRAATRASEKPTELSRQAKYLVSIGSAEDEKSAVAILRSKSGGKSGQDRLIQITYENMLDDQKSRSLEPTDKGYQTQGQLLKAARRMVKEGLAADAPATPGPGKDDPPPPPAEDASLPPREKELGRGANPRNVTFKDRPEDTKAKGIEAATAIDKHLSRSETRKTGNPRARGKGSVGSKKAPLSSRVQKEFIEMLLAQSTEDEVTTLKDLLSDKHKGRPRVQAVRKQLEARLARIQK